MAISDPVVMPLMEKLLDCFVQELAKVPAPPAEVQLRPGIVAVPFVSQHDNECCSGLGWVRVETFYPSSDVFPTQDEVPPAKGTASWAVTFELGVFRCAPTPEESAVPSGAQWHVVVEQMLDDAAAMRRAVCCLEESTPGRQRVLPGPWVPLDVQGGCSGGYLTVTVRAPACDCADAGPGIVS